MAGDVNFSKIYILFHQIETITPGWCVVQQACKFSKIYIYSPNWQRLHQVGVYGSDVNFSKIYIYSTRSGLQQSAARLPGIA